MTKLTMLAVLAGSLMLAALFTNAPASAAPFSVTGSAVENGDGNIEFVRHRRRQRAYRSGRGMPVFIVPGFYWGPAWWDASYWRQNRSRRNCANWFFLC